MAYYILSNPMLIQTYVAYPTIQLTVKSTSKTKTEVLLNEKVQDVEVISKKVIV